MARSMLKQFGNLTAEFDLQAEARDEELAAEIKDRAKQIGNLTAEFGLQAEAREELTAEIEEEARYEELPADI